LNAMKTWKRFKNIYYVDHRLGTNPAEEEKPWHVIVEAGSAWSLRGREVLIRWGGLGA